MRWPHAIPHMMLTGINRSIPHSYTSGLPLSWVKTNTEKFTILNKKFSSISSNRRSPWGSQRVVKRISKRICLPVPEERRRGPVHVQYNSGGALRDGKLEADKGFAICYIITSGW